MQMCFKYKRGLLLFVLLITAVQSYHMMQLQFDYDIAHLFPKNDPELLFHQEAEQKFTFYQPFLILGIENQEGVFNPSFLERLDRLTKKLEQHDLIQSVNSLTNIRNLELTPFGKTELPFIHIRDTARYASDSVRLRAYPDVSAKFLSTKGTAVCSYIQLKEALTENTKEEFRAFIEEQVAQVNFDKHYLYGDVFVKDSNLQELKSEMYALTGLSLLLIFIILFLTFRSVWGIVIPFIIVILTTVWTLGTMRLFGTSINVMTVLIPTIVSVISLTDVIHVAIRFREQPWSSTAKREGILLALKDIRIALLLTSITTSLGFLTLTYSSIQPFIEFGLFTAVGVGYAFLLAIFFLPLLLYWFPVGRVKEEQPRFDRLVKKLYQFIRHRQSLILLLGGLILLFSIAGMSKLRINSYLYEELSSKDAFSRTLLFFEEHFTGIRTFELHIQPTDTSKTILDSDILQEMDRLETYLMETYGLNEAYSILTQFKRLNRAEMGGQPEQFILPDSRQRIGHFAQKLSRYYDDLGLASILTRDHKEARMTGKIYDFGSAEIRKRNQHLQTFIDESIDGDLIKVRLTGSTLLLDKSNEIITWNLLYGLLFAILIVSIIMGLLYRSLKITLIALVPNVLPLIMILGIIGWVDMGLKMSTAIIFTIAFGIAVDDTLHFMSRLKSELSKGKKLEEAIRATYLSTGKAIIITSLILIFGFGILLFSSFQTTFITGLLVSLALLFALFADLILLPVLLILLNKGRGNK